MKKTASIKKALALLFTVIIFCGFVSAGLASNAASPVQLTVTSASGRAGDEVTISVNITANSGLAAVGLYLKYDNTKLLVKEKDDVFEGAAAAGGIFVPNEKFKTLGTSSTIIAQYVNTEGASAGGSLFDVVFTIQPNWSGSTELVLNVDGFFNNAHQTIPHNITNGSVSVGTASITNASASLPVQLTTAAQVPVAIEEIIELLGPDAGDWDSDYGTLNEEQKMIIREYYEDQGTPVEITPDGIYYILTTVPAKTPAESTTMSDGDDRKPMSLMMKIIIVILLAVLILAAFFVGGYMYRKKTA